MENVDDNLVYKNPANKIINSLKKAMRSNLALAVLSGLLTGLSLNFSDISFLAWLSLVPFIYILNKNSLKKVIFYGIFFGLSYYSVAIFWLTKVTILGFIFLLLYLCCFYAIFSVLARYFLDKHFKIITIPCLWVLIEFLKENIWCGFGWANLGYSQYNNFYLIQITDIFGAKFISFLIVLVNVLMWEVLLRFRQGASSQDKSISKNDLRIIGKILLTTIIFLLCFFYSFSRLKQLAAFKAESNNLRVAVVQPNIPQKLKWDHSSALSIEQKLKIMGVETQEDTLVIFPEAAWPYTLKKKNLHQITEFIKSIKRDVIIGAVLWTEGNFYNTALLFDKEANLRDVYRKIKLVPFGEYVPLRRFLNFINVINEIGDMAAGKEITQFSYRNKKKFSVLICFEDIFPLHVLRSSRNNDFLVNITNDAWFGGEPQASQHWGIMTFRAVENRISIIRSSNTGISGWVSFKGEIEKLVINDKDVSVPGIGNFTVTLNKVRSFYNKFGELFPIFCFIFVAFIIIIDKIKKRILTRDWEGD
ncbi:MAG: apolipoprotein N-acyltransferase [Omnitrophica bacterium]|nr:apolipoprotein N-acyltransferase [Candidatus Omnitrophota bacterium]